MKGSIPLQLDAVTKTFGSFRALEETTLRVEGGEMLALLGPSGCGKTTTLRIIAGFETPSTGSVFIGGQDVTELPPNKRRLGMVFQSYGLFPHMTVGENVAYGLKVRGMPPAERTKRVREMLELVRLAQFENRAIYQLSGGQQQRIALARSLVTDPTILLLDEPLGALDKNLRERMQFELREIQRRLGITCILVTHDQEEAMTMSNRIAVMSQGQIVQIGSPTEIYNRPRTRFVSEFLGTANIFAGTVKGVSGDEWHIQLASGGSAKVRAGQKEPAIGEQVTLAVRPEHIDFAAGSDAIVHAKVTDVVFRGSYHTYELTLEGGENVFVYSKSREDVPDDDRVGITWRSDFSVLLADGPNP